MSELRIVRGTDITLYLGDSPLFGVTAFSVLQKEKICDVYEYLCAKPCKRISQGTDYEIKLSMLAMFDRQLPLHGDFSLRVVDEGVTYTYEGCRVRERKTEVKGNAKAVEVFCLEADSVREEMTDDE